MPRHKDVRWNLPEGTPARDGSRSHSWESIHSAILMDIRDELQRLNTLLHCSNFMGIPWKLDQIRQHTQRIPVRPRKVKPRAKKEKKADAA